MSTLYGQAMRLKYDSMIMAIDADEFGVDEAFSIQEKRKRLDLEQFSFISFVNGYPVDTESLREIFMIHWERFSQGKDPIGSVSVDIKMKVRQ